VTWYDTEIGRFLCFGGFSGGNTTFLYQADHHIQRSSQILPDIVDISENITDCNIDYECRQACVPSVVKSLAINLNTTLPHPYVLKRRACGAEGNSVKDGDSFKFVLLLVFGVVSMEYRGKHQFIISSDSGRVDVVSTNVTVFPADFKPDIELQDILDPKVNLNEQDSFVAVCKVTGRSDVVANNRWVRNRGNIPQLHYTSTCNSTSVFYTVKYNEVRVTNYLNASKNSVIASLFTMTLYICNATMALVDMYSCEGYGSSKPFWLSVQGPEDSENELEVALIIGFIVLNSVLLLAIGMTLGVLAWIRHSNKKQSCRQLISHNAGLPVCLHSDQQIDRSFLQDSDVKSDPLEFPVDQLELLHPLGMEINV